jgi:hypothetical protein
LQPQERRRSPWKRRSAPAAGHVAEDLLRTSIAIFNFVDHILSLTFDLLKSLLLRSLQGGRSENVVKSHFERGDALGKVVTMAVGMPVGCLEVPRVRSCSSRPRPHRQRFLPSHVLYRAHFWRAEASGQRLFVA